jgi:hypothetical protein
VTPQSSRPGRPRATLARMLEALKALLRSKKFLIAVISMIVWAAGR